MLEVRRDVHMEVSDRPGIGGLIREHPVTAYFALMYLVTWLVFLPAIFGRSGLGIIDIAVPTRMVTSIASILGLALMAIFMASRLYGSAGVQQMLRRFVTWRIGVHWYFVALFGAPLLFLIGATVMLGSAPARTFLQQGLSGFAAFLANLLSGALLINLWEEAGLMGFPFLILQRRYGPVKASLILGPLWALMHAPALFLPGAVAPRAMPVPQMLVFMVVLMVLSLPVRIILTWLFNHTKGSFLFVALFHAGFDLTTGPINKLVPAFNTLEFMLVCTMFAVLLIVVTRRRLGYEPEKSQPSV